MANFTLPLQDYQLEQAKEDWHYYNIFDLASPVFEKIIEKLRLIQQEKDKALNQFKQPVTSETMEEHNKLIEYRNEVSNEIAALRGLRQLKNQNRLVEQIRESISNSAALT